MHPAGTGPRLEDLVVLGSELGRGGFGVVLEGRHRETGRRLAVKLSTRELDPESLARLAREIELIRSLRHPRLCTLHAALPTETGKLALVYEFLEGEPLDRVLARGIPPREHSLRWVRDLAEALDFLHGRGLVHRDLKPANVMIEPSGRARLIDFGLAREVAEGSTVTAEGMLLGTPECMAPELFRGERAGSGADRFALGVMAYWLLGGHPPFPCSSLGELLQAQEAGPAPLGGLPGGGRELFASLLAVRPEARPCSGAELVNLLEASLGGAVLGGAALQEEGPTREMAASGTEARGPDRTRVRAGLPADPVGKTEGAGAAATVEVSVAPPRPRFPLLPALLSLVLAASLGSWLVSTGPERGDLPKAPPELIQETPDPLGLPFPTSTWMGIRERLTSLQGARVGPGGELVPEGGSPDLPLLLGGDPAVWPRLLREFPEVARFADWALDQDEPWELPGEFREELVRTDEYFWKLDLPRPFGVYLAERPASGAGGLAEDIGVALGSRKRWVWVRDARGWEQTAVEAWARCLQGYLAREAELRGGEARFGSKLSMLVRLGQAMDRGLGTLLSSAFRSRETRIQAVRWVREETQLLHRALLATGRVLRHQPERAGRLVALSYDIQVRVHDLLRGHHLQTPLAQLLGPPRPDSPARALLEGQILGEQARMSAEVGLPDPGSATRLGEIRRLLQTLEPAPGEPPHHFLWMNARLSLHPTLVAEGRLGEALEGLRPFLDEASEVSRIARFRGLTGLAAELLLARHRFSLSAREVGELRAFLASSENGWEEVRRVFRRRCLALGRGLPDFSLAEDSLDRVLAGLAVEEGRAIPGEPGPR